MKTSIHGRQHAGAPQLGRAGAVRKERNSVFLFCEPPIGLYLTAAAIMLLLSFIILVGLWRYCTFRCVWCKQRLPINCESDKVENVCAACYLAAVEAEKLRTEQARRRA